MIDNKILEETFTDITQEKSKVLITGFSQLDEILSEARQGSLITIGGRPSMGKTSFALSILLNLLRQNKKCIFFSFDYGTKIILKRLFAQITDISLLGLSNNKMLEGKDIIKLEQAKEEISKFDLFINDSLLTIDKVINDIEKNKPDYIFIDHLQLFKTGAKDKSQWEIDLAGIVQTLKDIAVKYNCIIFLLSQLTRPEEYRGPFLSDLRECDTLEEVSDVVLLIHRKEYYNFKDEEDWALNRGKAEIIIAKNKMGSFENLEFLFNSNVAKFIEPSFEETF